jgi:hypothetical protein
MNHLEAIDSALAAGQPHNEIARKVFLSYPTRVFVGREELQYEILNEVAKFFGVPFTSVQVAGSAKLGYSVFKKTDFVAGSSDLDLAVIDTQLFARYFDLVFNMTDGYSDGSKFPIRDGKSTEKSYRRYIALGLFRPDLMPTGEARSAWQNFFGQLSTKHHGHFESISAGIYISQSCFEQKQRSAIRLRAETEIL